MSQENDCENTCEQMHIITFQIRVRIGSAEENQYTLIFSTDFRKNSQTPNFMKIRRVEAVTFHADQQTRRN